MSEQNLPNRQESLFHCTALTVGGLSARRIIQIKAAAVEREGDATLRVKTYGMFRTALFEVTTADGPDHNAALYGAVSRVTEFPGVEGMQGDDVVGARVGEVARADGTGSDWVEPQELTAQARMIVDALGEMQRSLSYLDPADFTA